VLGGIQGFPVWPILTARPLPARVSAGSPSAAALYRFQGLGSNGYKLDAAGVITKNNENLYLILPLTRYNASRPRQLRDQRLGRHFRPGACSAMSTPTRATTGPDHQRLGRVPARMAPTRTSAARAAA
jgi:hypothetical protein